MWKIVASLVLIFSIYHTTEGTRCYQCDSWQNTGCGEDDYLYDRPEFLTPCGNTYPTGLSGGGQYQGTPQSCLKRVTYFLHDKNSPALDPYHKYSKPHVYRGCGISLNVNQNPNYQRGEEYYYDDRCYKTETIFNSIPAEMWTCTCTGDECNSASKFQGTIITGMFSLTMILLSRALLF